MSFCKAAMLAMLLLIGDIAPVRADGPSEAFLKRVDELVGWIARHTDYPSALKTAPNFVFLAPADIKHGFANTQMGYSRDKEIVAAQTANTIILPDNFTLGRDDYMLLHELVHYMQYETGNKFPCNEEREREAYVLQTAFVIETGIGRMPNDMFMLMLRCDIR